MLNVSVLGMEPSTLCMLQTLYQLSYEPNDKVCLDTVVVLIETRVSIRWLYVSLYLRAEYL